MTRATWRAHLLRIAAAWLIVVCPAARGQDQPPAVNQMLQRALSGAETNQQQLANDPVASNPKGQPVDVDDVNVEVSRAGAITLNVVDLPLSTVLRVLAMQTGRNIIATPAVQGTVNASVRDVSFEEALDAILLMNNATYRAEGNFIYVYSREEYAAMLEAENPPETRVFHLNYLRAADLISVVTPLLSAAGSVTSSLAAATGIATSAEEAGGDSPAGQDYLVVTDRPDNLEAVARLISELDVRPRQVLIEATILSAQLNEDNALGVDFTLVGGVDLELLGSTSVAVQDLNVGQLPQSRLEQFNASLQTDFTQDLPNGGLRIGIIKDNVGLFIQALDQITDTVVLANPKVLALNKQRGQVIVGRRDGFITTTVTETQAIQTVEFLETGTQLVFRPFISDDGYVRLELHPEDSVGGLNASNLPFEQTTEVTTNVVVKDGQSVLIGGLFREVDGDTRSQIPGLGNIPVLGALFQSRQDSLQRQEVIILLTVHVVKDVYTQNAQARQTLEDIERIRVGLRQGQMWQGRDRIAQAHYQSAVKLYKQGDHDKALWHVRMALHNNPRFLSAIKLQEELRGRRKWDDGGTITRDFIYDAIMRQQGLDEPRFDRPQVLDKTPPTAEAPMSEQDAPLIIQEHDDE